MGKPKIETCSRCNQVRPVCKRLNNHDPICYRCFSKYYNIANCSICGKERPIHTRHDSKPICTSCYRKQKLDVCSTCKQLKYITKADSNQRLCLSCYCKQREEIPCFKCKKLAKVHSRDKDKNPYCQVCYVKYLQKKEVCFFCGKISPVKCRDDKGNPYCDACDDNVRPLENCSKCGDIKIAHQRLPDGSALCVRCYKPTPAVCANCKRTLAIHYWDKDNKFCKSCYGKLYLLDVCSKCGEKRQIITRTKEGLPICDRCYQQPKETCFKCGNFREVTIRIEEQPFCNRCYEIPERICSRCGKIGRIQKKEGQVLICTRCYDKPKEICSSCEKTKPVAEYERDKPLCISCYHKKHPEKRRRYDHTRRGEEAGLTSRAIDDDYRYVQERDKMRCVYCANPWKKSEGKSRGDDYDHLVSFNERKNDTFLREKVNIERENLVLACRKCNNSKRGRNVLFWLRKEHRNIPFIVIKQLKKLGVYKPIKDEAERKMDRLLKPTNKTTQQV